MRSSPPRQMVAAASALLVALALPAAAGASGFSQLYQDYGSDGQIQSCQYSAGDLRNAAGSIPPDVQAYDPGYGDALNGALGAACGGGATAVAAAPPPPPSGPPPVDPRVADRKRTKHVARDGSPQPVLPAKPSLPLSAPALDENQDVPLAFLALAVALGLLVVTGSGVAIGRYFGWDLARASGPTVAPGSARRARIGEALGVLRDRIRA